MLKSSHHIASSRQIRTFRSCRLATGPTRTCRDGARIARGEFPEGDRGQQRGLVVDLTDRKLVEDRLRLQSAALTSADNAILITDARGCIAWVNPAFTRLTGYTAEEAVGQNPRLLKSDKHDQVAYKELWETISSGQAWRGELINRRKDRGLYTDEQTITPILDARGTVSHFIAISHGITERKRAKDALRASETRFRTLVEDVPCGVFQSTPEGRFLLVNRVLVDMLGYASEQELLAIDIARDLYERPEDRERIKEQLEAKGQLLNIETSFKCKDGRRLTILANYRAVRDEHGTALYYQGTNTDISEKKQLEEQFRQAQKMEAMGRLAGGIAHDFNNLLTTIFGYSDLVLDRVRDHPDIAVDVEEIKKAGERACRLTRQLLAFSRKQILRPQVLDLNQVVGDLEKMLSHIIGEDIRLDMVAAPSLGHTKADPGQVEQLLMNLVVNARDAMPQGGTLTIATANVVLDSGFAHRHVGSVPGRYVSLTVQDTGCGMTPEVLAHIFEPFFTTKGPDKGTGLGLSTVYGVVKQSGGFITVESTPGTGTTVTTYWPTVDGPVESTGAGPSSVKTLKGTETILVVEDDTGIRDLIRKVLEGYGYTVLQARDVGDAIAIEESHRGPIHVLVSDIIMPGLNGPDLAQRIVRRRPAIKVLFVSGFANQAGIDLGSISRSASFLQKPFAPETLATNVRECLGASNHDGTSLRPG